MKWPTSAASITCPYCEAAISLSVSIRERRLQAVGGAYTVFLDVDRREVDKHEDGRCLS
jgi:hypothetical protein